MSGIAILDFGSQTAQLIARRVREQQVYCELFPWDASASRVLALRPAGFILSGGPSSVYEDDAPFVPPYVLESGLPILGICYGMQAITHALGGRVAAAGAREYGPAEVDVPYTNALLPVGRSPVWMSHGDRIEQPPPGFSVLAGSAHAPVAAMADPQRRIYAVQFHPEVHHTPGGGEMLRRFAVEICQAAPDWTPASIITQSVERMRAQAARAAQGGAAPDLSAEGVRAAGGDPNPAPAGHLPGAPRERPLALCAVSGGVDSAVAAALAQRALGRRLVSVFVDTGLLRLGEAEQVQRTLAGQQGIELICVAAQAQFFEALKGVTAPESKRQIIGALFIRIFEDQARRLGAPPFLVQGTIYPDVVESSAPDRATGHKIKTHHNVGGLPTDLSFELMEPLRYLFKDEVRQVGEALGLPLAMVWRQPFPGPGLAVRCLGEVTPERIARLQLADAIFTQELDAAGLLHLAEDGAGTSQAFAVLLPVRSVGVMGDQRTYQECVALRAVTSADFMTADWARLPYDLLGRVANRIVNEVSGVNRVVLDITSKPPATIEWE